MTKKPNPLLVQKRAQAKKGRRGTVSGVVAGARHASVTASALEGEVLANAPAKTLALLRESSKPISAYEILDQLRQYGMRSPPTIYRALDALLKQGLIHKVESLNAYVACHNDKHAHAAHGHSGKASLVLFAICAQCGAAEEVAAPSFAKAVLKYNPEFLAAVQSRILEIKGVCQVCSTKAGGN